jgi:hypothetical protein
MSAADKLRLRKEIETYHGFARGLTRADLFGGRWFAQFIERTLASFASAPTPPEIKERFKSAEGEDDLVDAVVTAAIHESIAATDAYEENLTGTEVRNLTDKKNAKSQDRLTGDSVALLAELAYTVLIDVKMIFNVAAAMSKAMNAGQIELVEEIFGRALGAFDFDAARAEGSTGEKIGAKIYDRAVVQPLGTGFAEAQRKGFYCYYAKAISKEARKALATLPAWEAPKAETGPMAATAMDDGTSFES